MLRSGIILLLLHQGYALISVTTVHLGDPVTFTCVFPDAEYSNTRVKWYKQIIGDTLVLITTLMKATTNPTFEQGFPSSRFVANHTTIMSTLTILETNEEDEAVYHCAVTTWSKDQWISTYLSLKGITQRTTDYNVVQWPVSDPVHPGDAVTLQCSVLSMSEKKSCPGEHSVHWFGVRSDKNYANTIYAGGNRHHECDKRPDAQSLPKSCVYQLSKNVSSSDAGIYYCAVAACGQIIFGNGTKLDIGSGTSLRSVLQVDSIILFLLCATSAISLIVLAIVIYSNKKNKCDYCSNEADVSLQENFAKRNLKRDEEPWIYSTALFTMMRTGTGGISDAKSVERERIYAAVKAFGLN